MLSTLSRVFHRIHDHEERPMVSVSVANLSIGCLVLITIGAKAGKWQNRQT